MRRDQPRGRQARNRPECGGRHRDRTHGPGDRLEPGRVKHRGADRCTTLAAGTRHAAAPAFVQAHKRHQVLQRQFLGVDALAQAGLVGRAAAQREVLAADHAVAAVDASETENEVCRRERDDLSRLVTLDTAGTGTDLAKARLVQHAVDPFANGQPALRVLARHVLPAALLPGDRELVPEFGELTFPGHGQSPQW